MDRQYSIPHSSRLLTRTHKKGEAKPDEKDRFQHIMPVCVYRDVSDGNKEEEGRRAPHRKPPTPPLFHPLRLPLFYFIFSFFPPTRIERGLLFCPRQFWAYSCALLFFHVFISDPVWLSNLYLFFLNVAVLLSPIGN